MQQENALRDRRAERSSAGVPRHARQALLVGAATLAGLAGVASSASGAGSATRGLEGYGYELVSPVSTAGQRPYPQVVADTGEDVIFRSSGGFADAGYVRVVGGHLYRSRRTASGWMTASLGLPPLAQVRGSAVEDWQANWWQTDRPLLLAGGTPAFDPDSTDNGGRSLVGTKGGAWLPITPSLGTAVGSLSTTLATADDLSRVVTADVYFRPPLADGTVDTRTAGHLSLKVNRRLADGTLDVRQLGRQAGVTLFPTCAMKLGNALGNGVVRGAVDRDRLQRVIWTTIGTGCTTGARQRVWVSEPFSSAPDAFDISASQCTVSCGAVQPVRFAGASLGTDRIFMTTTQKLLDAETNPAPASTSTADTYADIYEYDFRRIGADRLRLVTGNSTPPQVLGVVTVSDTGSHMYFVAKGVLDDAVTGDTTPVAGSPNLYVRIVPPSGGPAVTRFLATLDATDSAMWGVTYRPAATTPDGRYLFVTSRAALTSDKLPGDTLPDIYRIDSTNGQIVRAWVTDPAHNGAARIDGSGGVDNSLAHLHGANSEKGQRDATIASDGSAVIFTSKEPLVEGDDNGQSDVFVWRATDGGVAMISDGHDADGVTTSNVRMTPDGRSFVLTTASRLVPQHTSTAYALYAYRLGGGFAPPPDPPAECAGEACQGELVGAPRFDEGGSNRFFGSGNETPAAPKVATVRVLGGRSVRGSTVRLRLRASTAGDLKITGSGLRTTTRSVGRAGTLTVAVSLSSRGESRLQRRGRLTIPASVRFAAADGPGATARVSLRFTKKRQTAKKQTKKRAMARTVRPRTEGGGR